MASILGTFSVLKDHLKLKYTEDNAVIDNIVFRLHYRATFLILVSGSLLVSARQFFGEHIKCIIDKGSLPSNVVDTFCFFTSTYTVSKHMNKTLVELGHIPHPGVGPFTKDDEITHHVYYQWVPFVLFFQALLFYIPRYLWRNAEGGRMKALVSGLHLATLALHEEKTQLEGGRTIPSKRDRDEKIQQIRNAFLNRLHINRPWAYYMSFCELINFTNVLVQIYITDAFLGGAFLDLGLTTTQFEHSPGDKMTPLDIVFPKVTKCTFHKYGPSGTIQQHDALCVMALNIINEKIYIFLWFWFIILAIVTGLGLVWRMLTMLLHSRSIAFNRYIFSVACPGKYNPWNVLKLTHDYYYGDWLFLYYLAKNLDNYVFKELLEKLAYDLEERKAERLRQLKSLSPENEPLKQA
ncbi:Similar to Inx7: Innexin inx7 (Drosophila melanogaster) [Cotesia congregata]|uniref:Innexin n=1 Tax=Cotesia congregata TaxID=51543 RepID=A0A8J2MJB5_COTCN|nr:Similar to Inx7: Innexin inx7 (Drosophila melanogaster) [Cotesia congregata]